MRLFAAVCLMLSGCAAAQPIVVDGAFDDWQAGVSTSDPAGDASGQLDVTSLGATLVGDTIYLRLGIAGVQNMQAGSEESPDLSIVVEPDGGTAVELACRGRQVRRVDTGQVLRWDAVNYAVAPTFASESFEIRIDLSSLGGVGPGGATVRVTGCDALDTPLVVSASSGLARPQSGRALAVSRKSVRLASLNTLQTGLFSSNQAPKLSRLLKAADADVYLLQEEYNSSEAAIVSFFNALRPLDGGASWNVHKRGDTAVVSRLAMTDLPNYDTSYSAVAVSTDEGPVVIVSMHPKCCGYIGSSEDARRISQADLTARLVDEVRAGQHGASLVDAPVIIGGDWNLVGSRGPLDRLTAPALADVQELRLVRTGGGDTTTWRELDGLGFAPGRLDLIVYDAEQLRATKAEVWDTSLMSAEELSQRQLQGDDSTGSDHLLVVTEFARRRK